MEQIDHLNMTTKFACHKIAFATFAIACLSAQPAVADRISAGPSNTCFITAGRTLRCWGSNEGGQIGDGTINQRLLPVDVLNEVIAVTSGIQHTCAATSDGAMYCWGNNLSGQVGNGFGGGDPFTSRVMQPTGVVGLTYGVAAISAGNSHSCAVTATGQAKCWGLNGNGQLGDFTTAMRLSPVDVVGMTSGVHAIAAGGYHTCALTPSKGVQCWGLNANGQLGTGTTNEALTPVNVIGMASGLTAVSAGQWHTCALTASGGVKCWGFNGNGQLGDGSIEQRLAPIDVIGLSAGVSAISAGTYHTCALTSDGVVKCWGFNAAGQLGDGSTAQSLVPVAVVGIGGGASAVTVGKYHTCAIASDGSARCWGDNGVGQLGDGTTIQRLTPASAVSAAVPIVELLPLVEN